MRNGTCDIFMFVAPLEGWNPQYESTSDLPLLTPALNSNDSTRSLNNAGAPGAFESLQGINMQ
jgi:hypothetical protein